MWINTFTGEIYLSMVDAFKTIISDMVHIKKCRTIKMFSIRKFD